MLVCVDLLGIIGTGELGQCPTSFRMSLSRNETAATIPFGHISVGDLKIDSYMSVARSQQKTAYYA